MHWTQKTACVRLSHWHCIALAALNSHVNVVALLCRQTRGRAASTAMPKELEAKIAALPQLREELSQAEASSSMAHVRLCMRMFFDVWVARLDVASLTLFHDIDGTSCRRGCGAVGGQQASALTSSTASWRPSQDSTTCLSTEPRT